MPQPVILNLDRPRTFVFGDVMLKRLAAQGLELTVAKFKAHADANPVTFVARILFAAAVDSPDWREPCDVLDSFDTNNLPKAMSTIERHFAQLPEITQKQTVNAIAAGRLPRGPEQMAHKN